MELERAGLDGNNGRSAERTAVKSTNRSRNDSDLCVRQPTDQKAGGSNPSRRATPKLLHRNGFGVFLCLLGAGKERRCLSNVFQTACEFVGHSLLARCKAEPLPIVCCRYTSSFFFSTRRSVSANTMLPASASSSRYPHRVQAGAFRARLFSSQLLEKKHKSRYNRENTGGAGMHQRTLEKGSSVVPILQSICQWAGVFYKDEGEVPMIQCHKCDHRG